jgi:hypothetical protein
MVLQQLTFNSIFFYRLAAEIIVGYKGLINLIPGGLRNLI